MTNLVMDKEEGVKHEQVDQSAQDALGEKETKQWKDGVFKKIKEQEEIQALKQILSVVHVSSATSITTSIQQVTPT